MRMTKREADNLWRLEELPLVKQTYEEDGKPDYIARRESYNNFTDALCKEGRISSEQYSTWMHPRECG